MNMFIVIFEILFIYKPGDVSIGFNGKGDNVVLEFVISLSHKKEEYEIII